MKISGEHVLHAPVAAVWDALLDPQVLVQTIPGCERLEATGENAYAMTVTAGVASIRGTYHGACTMSDLVEHESLRMKLDGAGAPGTVDATVDVLFTDAADGTTLIAFSADAVVGGMVGGVGQRMLTSVSRRMAGEMFGNVEKVIAAGGVTALAAEAPAAGTAPVAGAAQPAAGAAAGGAVAAPAAGQVFTAPAKASAAGSQEDFLKGVGLGAGLVLLGVVVGSLLGRRR
ncbi:SRPBCC family protein [Nocardioides pacificus]